MATSDRNERNAGTGQQASSRLGTPACQAPAARAG
jgi:hypothetical protein